MRRRQTPRATADTRMAEECAAIAPPAVARNVAAAIANEQESDVVSACDYNALAARTRARVTVWLVPTAETTCQDRVSLIYSDGWTRFRSI
jgi:hypothetical protein